MTDTDFQRVGAGALMPNWAKFVIFFALMCTVCKRPGAVIRRAASQCAAMVERKYKYKYKIYL